MIDEQTLRYPIDFSIDEIEVRGGPRVTIYEGVGLAEQNDVQGLVQAKSFSTPSGTATIFLGEASVGRTYFDVHFVPSAKAWGLVQIFGYLATPDDAAAVGKFISEAHPCTLQELATICRPEWPLEETGAFVSTLKPHKS